MVRNRIQVCSLKFRVEGAGGIGSGHVGALLKQDLSLAMIVGFIQEGPNTPAH